MRILHTYKSTNNGKFGDMPEKDAGGGRETGNLFGVALQGQPLNQKSNINFVSCFKMLVC